MLHRVVYNFKQES